MLEPIELTLRLDEQNEAWEKAACTAANNWTSVRKKANSILKTTKVLSGTTVSILSSLFIHDFEPK